MYTAQAMKHFIGAVCDIWPYNKLTYKWNSVYHVSLSLKHISNSADTLISFNPVNGEPSRHFWKWSIQSVKAYIIMLHNSEYPMCREFQNQTTLVVKSLQQTNEVCFTFVLHMT